MPSSDGLLITLLKVIDTEALVKLLELTLGDRIHKFFPLNKFINLVNTVRDAIIETNSFDGERINQAMQEINGRISSADQQMLIDGIQDALSSKPRWGFQ